MLSIVVLKYGAMTTEIKKIQLSAFKRMVIDAFLRVTNVNDSYCLG